VKYKLILIAGARPNFMKISPILRVLEKVPDLEGVLVHTGQHYDDSMSATFFKDLGIKEPDFNLEVGSGSHAVQTATIMIKFEEVCLREKPDVVLVVGDVNSTIAAGLVAKKLNIALAHVEAGLRSRDRFMPEEINRLATDAITDVFFTTEKEGTSNLLSEGHDPSAVHFVGHVMIDNLFYQLSKIGGKAPSVLAKSLKDVLPGKYICMTMHRPSNVDNKEVLSRLLHAAKGLSEKVPIIFPCHPRTRKNIEQFGLISLFSSMSENGQKHENGFFITEPLGYNDFLYVWKDACLMLTDSGGLQEETTALKIPCITMRENTERPITAEVGSNIVVGTDDRKIIELGTKAINGLWKSSSIPELWDGNASERIVEIIQKHYIK
jgi:UDP-N-acetylglucosamine 2-epimerase (non-hydrolysing)